MRTPSELRSIKWFIVVSWALVLLIVIGTVFWGSYQIRELKNQLNALDTQKPTIIKGINGKDGVTTLRTLTVTLPAKDGKDGQNATPEQIAAAITNYLQKNPPIQGKDGHPGVDGRTLYFRVTSACVEQTKYTDDDTWTDQAQLPFPCFPNLSPQ